MFCICHLNDPKKRTYRFGVPLWTKLKFAAQTNRKLSSQSETQMERMFKHQSIGESTNSIVTVFPVAFGVRVNIICMLYIVLY